MQSQFVIQHTNSGVICTLSDACGNRISSCGISVNGDEWNIYSWYTSRSYQHTGYGKVAMKRVVDYCLENYGTPTCVQYTWNGQNEYVHTWMTEHFNARCKCPLAVQKYNCADDWESHLYVLDTNKFLQYIGDVCC